MHCKAAITFLLSISMACCTLNWRKQSAKEDGKALGSREKVYQDLVSKTQLRSDVQLNALNTADSLGAVSVFGLLSEAGYVDDGQTIIYVLPNGSGQIERTDSGSKSISKTTSLTPDAIKAFVERLSEFRDLADYSRPSFDGIRHEFVHYKRDQSAEPLALIQKTFIMTLQEGKDSEPYQKLLKVFKDLISSSD